MIKTLRDTTFLKTKRIIFFGNERLVSGLPETNAPILNGLIEQGYDVVAVVSHHSHSNSRSNRQLEVAAIASAHDIPVYLPNKPSEIIDELKALQPDIAVLVAYGRIISQQVIDMFPQGIVNIHPSMLPKYRGPTPIEAAILNGDTETGISIMQLTAGMDEGPVYAQQSVPISNGWTKLQLYQDIAYLSSKLFFEHFPKILDGSLHPVPQNHSEATYTQLIKKSDGIIDWTHKTAEQIEHEIWAYEGWPQSRTMLGNIEVIITKVHSVPSNIGAPGHVQIVNDKDASLIAIDATEGYLYIDALKPLGKKEMPVKAFLAGYQSKIS